MHKMFAQYWRSIGYLEYQNQKKESRSIYYWNFALSLGLHHVDCESLLGILAHWDYNTQVEKKGGG